MRLIDADAIPYTMLYKESWLKGTGVEEQGVFKSAIDAMPTIEAEPIKHGRWIKERVHNLHNGEKRNARECSECGAIYFVYDMANAIGEVPRYCPNCGARMDEVTE